MNLDDPRWGGYTPWFLRHGSIPTSGNFSQFFSRLSQRLKRVFEHNEAGILNRDHFAAWLESESLQRFRASESSELWRSISSYFDPHKLVRLAEARAEQDEEKAIASKTSERVKAMPQFTEARRGVAPTEEEIAALEKLSNAIRAEEEAKRGERTIAHYTAIIHQRLGVLEALLRILPRKDWYMPLIQDIRRFFVESGIMLDITIVDGQPQLVPFEESLLQEEVTNKLLPRLSARFPNRAKELVAAYHDFLKGKDQDEIFVGAFKSFEQLARDLTGDSGFVFDQSHLDRHFPLLHSTTKSTFMRLKGHRDGKGAHGKDAPPPYELRYLLFAICNGALLLLDYPEAPAQS